MYKMKDIFSLFLAISVITVSGVGLYIYNNKTDMFSDDDSSSQNEKHSENEDIYENQYNDIEHYEEIPKTRKQKNKINTKKNKKTNGVTKRKY